MPSLATTAPRLLSIGYEKASFADFVGTLRAARVATVIDVRDLPLSRRAGFSKRQLQAGLAEAGIGYLHLRPLGTPPAGREANRRRQWPLFWEIVEQSLGAPQAQEALAKPPRRPPPPSVAYSAMRLTRASVTAGVSARCCRHSMASRSTTCAWPIRSSLKN